MSRFYPGVGYFPGAPSHNIPSRVTFEPAKRDDSRPRGPEANRWLREEYAEWRKEERAREAKRRGFTSVAALDAAEHRQFDLDTAKREAFWRNFREERAKEEEAERLAAKAEEIDRLHSELAEVRAEITRLRALLTQTET